MDEPWLPRGTTQRDRTGSPGSGLQQFASFQCSSFLLPQKLMGCRHSGMRNYPYICPAWITKTAKHSLGLCKPHAPIPAHFTRWFQVKLNPFSPKPSQLPAGGDEPSPWTSAQGSCLKQPPDIWAKVLFQLRKKIKNQSQFFYKRTGEEHEEVSGNSQDE